MKNSINFDLLIIVMNQKFLLVWFCTISGILVFFGFLYSFFGLIILPVNKSVLLHWESALYGAIMMGWGATLFLIGQLAFRRNDTELMKIMLYGIFIWLMVEASFSAYLGVFFNVGVDIGVFVLFSLPLIIGIKYLNNKKN
jgi:hypothetical protein